MTAFCGVKWTFAVTLIFTFIRLGSSQDIFFPDERYTTSPLQSSNRSSGGSPIPLSNGTPTTSRSEVAKSSCSAPPQPFYGRWKLHPDFCKKENQDCKVPEDTELQPGAELIYECPLRYRMEGNNVVYCRHNNKWSSIPRCVKMKCNTLSSKSITANCFSFDGTVSCDSPVLPKTRAEVSCRPGYKEDVASLATLQGRKLTCNDDGDWEPRPLKCIPECGRVISHQSPLLVGGTLAKIGDFPWHASIYRQRNISDESSKQFICGATLIQDNLLLTAAHCVYDELTKATTDPETLFVVTGNIFLEYDSPANNPQIVQKGQVKNVYLHYYYGLPGNYASDIALMELKKPFVLSNIVLPACIDTMDKNAPILEPGAIGRIAGFGITDTGKASQVLQTITDPYVSYSQCIASKGGARNGVLITKDKFCAGYVNGTAICAGDSGGGLVFQNNGRWYIMGVASVSLRDDSENGVRVCNGNSYTLYTRVSDYTNWILQVIADEEQRKSGKSTSTTPIPNVTLLPTTPPSKVVRSSCLAPPQPTYGQWKGHPSICPGDEACNIPQGTELEPGSQLVYSCNDGYKPAGNTDVYCRRGGSWSSQPDCVKISCSSLNSEAVTVDCRNRTGSWISCDPSVPPQTWATVSCRLGYTEYATITSQTHRVFCNEAGKWEPEPIKCLPDCGKAITQQTPYVVNGTTARTGDFPWHASIYEEQTIPWLNETKKKHICGATIIQPNLLLTAAHCVYDADSGVERDPKKLFIMTGNVFLEYDYEWHNPVSVKKRRVKNVYRHCSYYGQPGAYASDIGLIELQEPFELSSLLLPACLYPSGHDEQILDHGAFGKVAGFGRTTEGPVSAILQTITVPYIPYHECKTSVNAEKNKYLISDDKFCAGYTNGSAVCDGDSGGGLVFQVGELWHVMGIVSVGLGVNLDSGEKTCDSHSYTLYTRVSRHIIWIREIMLGLHLNRPFVSCDTKMSPGRRNRRDSLHHLV